jgi:hypothetical protein
MIHSIKIKISNNIDTESLLSSIELLFTQNNFKVDRNGDKLTFERITSKKADKLQVIFELFRALTTGTIYFENDSQKELICKIYYFKQLAISLVVGIVICLFFSLYTGSFLTLFLKLWLPITLVFFVVGIMTGNSQVKKLLRKAIK